MEPYQPVDASFREELEILAALKKTCSVKFKGDNDAIATIETQLLGIYADSAEYLKTSSGLSIRLDRLIMVDGKQPEGFC